MILIKVSSEFSNSGTGVIVDRAIASELEDFIASITDACYGVGRPVIKPSKLSRGFTRAQLSGIGAQFGLLSGASLLLGLSLVWPNQTK